MIDQSPEAIALRREAHQQSVAIAALEGYVPTAEDEASFARYIKGEITIEDSIAETLEEIHASQAKKHLHAA